MWLHFLSTKLGQFMPHRHGWDKSKEKSTLWLLRNARSKSGIPLCIPLPGHWDFLFGRVSWVKGFNDKCPSLLYAENAVGFFHGWLSLFFFCPLSLCSKIFFFGERRVQVNPLLSLTPWNTLKPMTLISTFSWGPGQWYCLSLFRWSESWTKVEVWDKAFPSSYLWCLTYPHPLDFIFFFLEKS